MIRYPKAYNLKPSNFQGSEKISPLNIWKLNLLGIKRGKSIVEKGCVEIMAKEHTYKMLSGDKGNAKKAPKRKSPDEPEGPEAKDPEADKPAKPSKAAAKDAAKPKKTKK